jgi:ABC-type transporter Mla subunit MlaD
VVGAGVVRVVSALENLTREVAENRDAIEGAVTLIEGLAAEIAANADDPEQVAALAAELDANTKALAAAVLANTVTPNANWLRDERGQIMRDAQGRIIEAG